MRALRLAGCLGATAEEAWAAAGLGTKQRYGAAEWSKSDRVDTTNSVDTVLLPPFQIVSHSKNFRESNFFKFDRIYIIK